MGTRKSRKRMRREREKEPELRKRKARKNRLMIISAVIVGIIAVSIYFATSGDDGGSAGTGRTGGTSGIISPTWINAQVDGDTVSIPTSQVDSGKMLHFKVTEQSDSVAFMAYKLAGQVYARANVCPPCGSIGFSLAGGTLVCNSCGTKFEADTGEGISGACKDYPKAEVAHTISGDKITMSTNDLQTAYIDTSKPGWP